MSIRHPDPAAVVLGFLLVASAGTAIAAVVVGIRRAKDDHDAKPPVASVAPPAEPETPISAEAEVFRTGAAMLAIEPGTFRERTAHPRTLTTFRFLRAYPGAPPAIPHALSADEFRTGICRTCHERGGYSLRFSAYVPVTPHPEMGMCLQCHVGVDRVMGFIAPTADPNTRCSLCHGPNGGSPRSEAALTWPTAVWPRFPPGARGELPPPIPHGLQLRGNCLVCHTGPAAVREIRAAHPERSNCRQCHVAVETDVAAFTRPAADVFASSGDAP